jgi:hypothetical protein
MRDTTILHEAREPNRTDFMIALAVGVCALAAYVRTLAPDVLYGDSAEFQTLAYTLGMTHSTGYPVYLLLARLLGFLPIGLLAWRVSLLSAVGAATTVNSVFLLTRYLTHSRIGALLGSVALGLSYTFWSQAIFYLPTSLLIAIATGCGAGSVLEWAHRHLVVRKRRYLAPFYLLAVAFLVLMVVRPYGASRWQALRAGAATFVQEDYVYSLYNLEEPRIVTTWKLKSLPDNALVIMEWRALYTMYYLAHAEQLRPDITILEASPHGAEEEMVADTLIQELKNALREGRPVYADRVYGNLRDHFRVQPALGGEWYRLR